MIVPSSDHSELRNNTKFKYVCDQCATVDYLLIDNYTAYCHQCGRSYPLSPNDVIIFHTDKSEQNEHFDKLYASGYSPTEDRLIDEYENEYRSSKKRVKDLLKLWGLDKALPITEKSFLDVACGPGWMTAGLMQNRRIRNSSFHAFDLSATGLEMLAQYAKKIKTSNQLEMSVQNAERMHFSENTFDIIIGHSMLHHFPAYEKFLENCYQILKPGGIALFGEPFAIGYGLLAASLKLAQDDLGVNYPEINALYENISFRVRSSRHQLQSLVDKHLFFQSEMALLAQKIGFSSVDFVSFLDRDYYRNQFVTDELRLSYKINDEPLKKRANEIYKAFFDIFDSDKFIHAISAFMYIILRR
jgi:ubiquinone/menaquinone biosynthesis C-methylase UbiE